MCPSFRKKPKRPNYRYLYNEGCCIDKGMTVNCDGSRFLPCHLISKLAEHSKVQKALEAARVQKASRIADVVSDRAKRIFLILVLMSNKDSEKVSLIEDLQSQGFIDGMLPIEWAEKNGRWFAYSKGNLVSQGAVPDSSRPLVYIPEDKWDRQCKDMFEFYQWQLTAPKFNMEEFMFSFHNSTILPYVEKPPKPASSGFFGEVSHYKVHPAHIPILTDGQEAGPVSVAVKKALNPEELADFFQKETENLERIKGLKWDNLIQPIAAYQRNTERCIVFPWASGGSLVNYWEDHDLKYFDKSRTLWILGQFTGICRALRDLHKINCRHGDLKPDNILWFKDGKGKEELQIADLGLAAFHKDKNTQVRKREAIQTMTPSGTKRYEPPETNEHRYSSEPRSRAYDVWSMGCILLELLIWLVYGNNAVVAFGMRTDFFWQINTHPKPNNGSYAIHNVVQECIEALEISLQAYPAYTALLNLVQHKLLVVQGTNQERETAEKVHEEMEGILTKCNDEGCYLVTFRAKLAFPDILTRRDTRAVVHEMNGALAAPVQIETRPKLPTNQQNLQFDNVKLERQATMPPNASSHSLRVGTPVEQEQYVGSSSSLVPKLQTTDQ